MRLFVSIFSLFDSSASKKVFINSLVCGPDLEKYKFFSKYEVIAKIKSKSNPWEREKLLIAELAEESDYWLNKQKLLAKSSVGLNGSIGYCKELDNNPDFSRHFAFWDFEYDESKVSKEAVYFTFSSVVQYARENSTLEGDDSLKSSIYQQALISPENFLRFNDHALQATLIRCSEDCELDYRSSREYSSAFLDLILKLLDRYDSSAAEVIIDIFVAIAIGKIKLYAADVEVLRESLSSSELCLGQHVNLLASKVKRKLDESMEN